MHRPQKSCSVTTGDYGTLLAQGSAPIAMRNPVPNHRSWTPLGLLGSCAVLLLGTGCSTNSVSGSDKIVEIRYMAWGNPEQLALEEELCRLFEKKNPNIRVKFLRVPGSAYGNKMVVMLASRTAPDVLRVDHYQFAQLAKKKYFYDYTQKAATDPEFKREDFNQLAYEEGIIDGKFYGANVLFGAPVIYYNKTMFQKAGLTDPFILWKRGEWTYDAFVQSAKALTKKDKSGKFTQFGTIVPAHPLWFPFVWGFGGDLVDPGITKSVIDSQEAVRGLQFVADLRYVHKCAPTPSQSANSAFTFEGGKLGMEFMWMGMTPRYRNVIDSFEWDVVPYPRGPKGDFSAAKGNQLVSPKDTDHPEEAWKFIKFITGPEIERLLYIENRRCYPTRVALTKDPAFLDDSKPPSQIRIFVDAVRTAKPLPINERWGEWSQAMNTELDNLWAGRERDAQKVAVRAKRAVDKVLSEEPGW